MTFYTAAFRTFWCRIEGWRIGCNKGKSRGYYPSKPVTALKPHNMCVDMVPDQDCVIIDTKTVKLLTLACSSKEDETYEIYILSVFFAGLTLI